MFLIEMVRFTDFYWCTDLKGHDLNVLIEKHAADAIKSGFTISYVFAWIKSNL